MALLNPFNSSGIDDGVIFIKFLWEEKKAILEQLNQTDIDEIAQILEDRETEINWQANEGRQEKKFIEPVAKYHAPEFTKKKKKK